MPAPEPAAPKPAEERSYLAFAAAALALTLAAGLTLGILVALGEAGRPTLGARLPRLIQAHAWTQLQGWLGLLVAGMGLRLIPRLCGRRPLPAPLALSILVLLGTGALLRIVAQALLDGPSAGAMLVASAFVSAAGAVVLAASLAVALRAKGRAWQAWRLAAWAGTSWWIAWSVFTASGGLLERGALVPDDVDERTVWVMLLGVLSNFAWAVQARSVPVFYGRRPPGARQLIPPLLLLNAGVAVAAVSSSGSLGFDAGLGLAGLGTAWLAPVGGSVWGTATRLRPPSRPSARFIVAANRWAVIAGVLLAVDAVTAVASSRPSEVLRDGALHACGLGFMTTLILGVAQLLMPAFAGERALSERGGPESWLSFPAITLAAALRVLGAALGGDRRSAVVALSGVLAWIAVAAFAAGLLRAGRSWRRAAPKPAAPSA